MQQMRTEQGEPIAVDWSGIRSSSTQARVEEALSGLGRDLDIHENFWRDMERGGTEPYPRFLVVAADLGQCARTFKNVDRHTWASRMRSMRPYILAFVRGRLDERYADLVDDIVQASDNRMVVCELKTFHRQTLLGCLRRAIAGTDPESITDVRYSTEQSSLWLEFGDGRRVSVDWVQLGLDDVEPRLRPDTATVSDDLYAVEVLREDGEVFEIDSASLRSFVDDDAAMRLREAAAESGRLLGERVRKKRERAGLTQKQLAANTGLQQSLISKLERGKHEPRFETLERYADGLGMSVAELVA
jgi:DNA-binding XRE family transcriptional regulator